MARSQDELIDFLLAEIASSGAHGCTASQILSLINRFYAGIVHENGRLNKSPAEDSYNPSPTIDRIFQEQIWESLTQRPNVSVGRNRSFNRLALSDFEAVDGVDDARVTIFTDHATPSSQVKDDQAAAFFIPENSGVIQDSVFGQEINLQTNSRRLHEVGADNLERDESGFPRRPRPTSQYRNGQARLEEGMKATNPSDFEPSTGDLVSVEKGNGEYIAEEFNADALLENDDYCAACGDIGELICCDGCPNAYHGACLEPPLDTNDLPDDQWYCPRCETNSVPNDSSRGSLTREFATSVVAPSSMRMAAKPRRRTSAKQRKTTKPLGRPRKFLAGTEQFWRTQFPNAPALFASRPPNFDATLLRALQKGLPTPADPADISQNWIEKTLAVLERSSYGLYISPKGNLQRGPGNRKATSQIVILKSARLREVDFSDSKELSAVRFLSSSAAHTFSSLRYYPQATAVGRQSRPRLAESPRTRKIATPQPPARRKGPKLGVFYDDRSQQHSSQHSFSLPATSTLRRNSRHSLSTTGSLVRIDDTDSKSPTCSPRPVFARPRDTVNSQDDFQLEDARHYAARGIANRLPPPLTTRAASRRQAATLGGFAAAGAAALQDVATSTRSHARSPATPVSLLQEGQSRKRQLSEADGVPKKRARKTATGSLAAPMRQQIILDLIERSGGAIPDNPLLLWNAVTASWHKSGQAGVPDKRTVDANLKALCTAGKVKKSTFSFKDQRGLMIISSILAKPEMRPLDPIMRQLQQHIIDVYPNHYTPSGMYPDQVSQLKGISGPQLGVQPETQQEASTRRDESRQPSSNLQPIENEASSVNKNVERLLGTMNVTRPELLECPGLPRTRSVGGDISVPRSSPRTFSAGLSKDASFLMRQEQPIVFDPSVPSSFSNSAEKLTEKENKKVIWRKSAGARPMPRSLTEILDDGPRGEETDIRLRSLDLDLRRFESEVDSVARWEERSFNRFQERNDSQNWNFISHFVNQDFEAACLDNIQVQFNGLTWYDTSEQEKVYLPPALRRLWSVAPDTQLIPATGSFVTAQQLDTSETTQSQTMHTSGTSPRASNSRSGLYKKRKRKSAKTKPSKKRKGKEKHKKHGRTEVEPAYITNPDGTVVDVSGYINAPVKRARGTQHLRNMSEATIYRLAVAIVVIRTLSGGIDKHIDWKIVMRIFPEENLNFIHDRWKTIRTKFRRDIAALTENLQHRFCSAYVEGEVPELDFDDLYNNDWPGIVDWAVQNLDKSFVKGIEDLPDTREELADTKVMSFEEQRGMRDYLGYNVGSSLPIREAAQASTVFAKSVESVALEPPAFSDVLETEDEQLKIAKSWALTTVLTPEESYDAYAAKKKLSKLANTSRASEALFDRAEKSLKSQRTIFLDPEAPSKIFGRGHKPSKLFYDAIDARRTIQARILRQAARYKRDVLDPVFNDGQRITFQSTTVQDGDMVAILNLLAHGRLRLQIGSDVPKNRYGLLSADGTGTYQTRQLEKDRLGFSVLIEAVEGKYVSGNPVEVQLVPVPVIPRHDTTALPVWVDIHGSFQEELWELVVCAVVGLVSTRAGIDAKELVKTLSPTLTLWETEMVLEWLRRSGLVEASGEGGGRRWNTEEWWWLVCGGVGGWHLGGLY